MLRKLRAWWNRAPYAVLEEAFAAEHDAAVQQFNRAEDFKAALESASEVLEETLEELEELNREFDASQAETDRQKKEVKGLWGQLLEANEKIRRKQDESMALFRESEATAEKHREEMKEAKALIAHLAEDIASFVRFNRDRKFPMSLELIERADAFLKPIPTPTEA